jgi:hypothetical protein
MLPFNFVARPVKISPSPPLEKQASSPMGSGKLRVPMDKFYSGQARMKMVKKPLVHVVVATLLMKTTSDA